MCTSFLPSAAMLVAAKRRARSLMGKFSKKTNILLRLSGKSAPRIFSPGSLALWLEESGIVVAPRSLTDNLAEWAATGSIERITGRIYLNCRAKPQPTLDEAAPFIRPGAIASLNFILAQQRVLNESSPWVSAVVSNADTTKVGKVQTENSVFRFAALPAKMIIRPGHALGQLAVEAARPWRATPEKALLDLLYLAGTPRGASSWPLPVCEKWNLDALDKKRLDTLANGLGMTDTLTDFSLSLQLGLTHSSQKIRLLPAR